MRKNEYFDIYRAKVGGVLNAKNNGILYIEFTDSQKLIVLILEFPSFFVSKYSNIANQYY